MKVDPIPSSGMVQQTSPPQSSGLPKRQTLKSMAFEPESSIREDALLEEKFSQ